MIRWMRGAWDRVALYLPILMMGVLALGTYGLMRSSPSSDPQTAQAVPRMDPDYEMEHFSIKTFDAGGHLRSELFGDQGRHYPQTDILEIDHVRVRSYNERGFVTVATAQRGLSNGDGSEIQLIGDAVIVREAGVTNDHVHLPRLSLRSEFLHAFIRDERVRTNKPVELMRGEDRITADSLDYDNLSDVADLRGRVRGVLQPAAPAH